MPTYFLGPNDAQDLEPDLGDNVLAALLSTESGIVDSHALMGSLEAEIQGQEAGNGSVVLGTKVVRIDPYRDEAGGESSFFFWAKNSADSAAAAARFSGATNGWVVQTLTEGSDRPDAILTKALILSAGLSCVHLLNPLLPPTERLKAYYAKGEFAPAARGWVLMRSEGQVPICRTRARG